MPHASCLVPRASCLVPLHIQARPLHEFRLAMKRSLLFGTFLTGLCFALSVTCIALSGCSSVARSLNIVNPRYSIRDVRPRVAIALPLSASTIDFDFALGV